MEARGGDNSVPLERLEGTLMPRRKFSIPDGSLAKIIGTIIRRGSFVPGHGAIMEHAARSARKRSARQLLPWSIMTPEQKALALRAIETGERA